MNNDTTQDTATEQTTEERPSRTQPHSLVHRGDDPDITNVRIVDVDLSFFQMVIVMTTVFFAAIPAAILVWLFWLFVTAVLGVMGITIFR